MEIINENDNMTAIQRAKSKYYKKNRESIIQKINEIHKNKYHNDNEFRENILANMKAYYQANKQKKKEYYLKRKQQTLTQ